MTRDDKMFVAFKIAMTAVLATMSFGTFFMCLGGIANWPAIESLGMNMVMGAMFVLGLAIAIMAPVGLWFLPPLYERPNEPVRPQTPEAYSK